MTAARPSSAIRAALAAAALVACGGRPAGAPAAPGDLAATAPGSPASCAELPHPTEIAVDTPGTGEIHELFDLPDTPALWAAAPEDAAAPAYREGVVARLGPDIAPRTLLARQRAVFAAAGHFGEVANADAILQGRVGAIAAPTCLERLLFARQAARYPMLTHPTEFGAFLLRGHGRVRVYMSTAGRVGMKIRSEITHRVRDDAARGYAVVAHLHNHPFLFDRRVGDRMWTTPETQADVAGALAPSLSDAQFYKSLTATLPLEAAWITNGLSSIRISAPQLASLATPPAALPRTSQPPEAPPTLKHGSSPPIGDSPDRVATSSCELKNSPGRRSTAS